MVTSFVCVNTFGVVLVPRVVVYGPPVSGQHTIVSCSWQSSVECVCEREPKIKGAKDCFVEPLFQHFKVKNLISPFFGSLPFLFVSFAS